MKHIIGGTYTGERALYDLHGARIENAVFCDGESPLKECSDLYLSSVRFEWKYPLWYTKNVEVKGSLLTESARSGIWYTHNISFADSRIEAPKTFRRATGISLVRTDMPNAEQTLWSCSDVVIDEVYARGDYFCMNCDNVRVTNFKLDGNYGFDGARNVTIENARLMSKDAFWNTENVTVKDSVIVGEYLGWNSKNLTFINCTIESNQGLCYIENLKLVNCSLVNTDLALELSTVDCEIVSHVDSIKNPISGRIHVKSVGELILDAEMIDPEKTEIIIDEVKPSGTETR